jgi:hypothetical protein
MYKNERSQVWRLKVCLQLLFPLFLVYAVGHILMTASPSKKKVKSFHEVHTWRLWWLSKKLPEVIGAAGRASSTTLSSLLHEDEADEAERSSAGRDAPPWSLEAWSHADGSISGSYAVIVQPSTSTAWCSIIEERKQIFKSVIHLERQCYWTTELHESKQVLSGYITHSHWIKADLWTTYRVLPSSSQLPLPGELSQKFRHPRQCSSEQRPAGHEVLSRAPPIRCDEPGNREYMNPLSSSESKHGLNQPRGSMYKL